jgi:hypothetical protein
MPWGGWKIKWNTSEQNGTDLGMWGFVPFAITVFRKKSYAWVWIGARR